MVYKILRYFTAFLVTIFVVEAVKSCDLDGQEEEWEEEGCGSPVLPEIHRTLLPHGGWAATHDEPEPMEAEASPRGSPFLTPSTPGSAASTSASGGHPHWYTLPLEGAEDLVGQNWHSTVDFAPLLDVPGLVRYGWGAPVEFWSPVAGRIYTSISGIVIWNGAGLTPTGSFYVPSLLAFENLSAFDEGWMLMAETTAHFKSWLHSELRSPQSLSGPPSMGVVCCSHPSHLVFSPVVRVSGCYTQYVSFQTRR